ncbi:MAG: FIG002813: LPPG:FO 2-phospho-L-lactate transferase like, CofD-like [uncultured Acidimicrobiales bacterium]|uniref:Putative gluconeogenesis factor n=1 Tax=uncultured Acidimicrobiales bacterium TaxID=310071 RepID=A0A6J4H6E9_9ACTN|nr:MAG: FIG002813: LPPG:FO 2-phospho-L-lactate transferase like, CofD-like [uncultured Acidimicrobiales bacterium]
MTSAARPRVVALGGGHGLAATLVAARRYAGDVTGIVSVADDGGSSGRLREALGIPAPGDLRRCLVALGEPGSVWGRAFEHRFEAGELRGHALGNVVIAGLAATTGSFIDALVEAGRLVGATGRVLPATLDPVVLKAQSRRGDVEGQVAVAAAGDISCVSVVPADPPAPSEALDAIAEADQILLGPGSLFTSVLAVVAVPELRAAIRQARAPLTYICNLRDQDGETTGFDVAAHVAAVIAHGLTPDTVVYDPDALPVGRLQVRSIAASVADAGTGGHDPGRLAVVLADLVG